MLKENSQVRNKIKLKNQTTRPSTYEFYVLNSDAHEEKYANYYLQYEEEVELFGTLITRDLINIAVSTFMADKRIERLKNSKRFSTRNIEITIPVSNKDKWNRVKEKLERIISFLSYDNFKYKFVEDKDLQIFEKNSTFETKADCVCLFSGGLDSFSGGHYLINQQNRYPFFVSVNHSNTGKLLNETQKSLYPKHSKFIFRVQTPKNFTREYTQFTRSFLYLAFATEVAKEYGFEEIFIPETGIVATQIGLKRGRLVTRTVHPHFLDLFNHLLDELFENEEVKIINPFKYQTKGEVVSHLLPNTKEFIPKTVSCPNRRFYERKHCGMCMSCIIRKIALVSNDLTLKDAYGKKSIDLIDEVDLTNPKRIKYFGENVLELNNRKRHYRDGISFIFNLIELVRDLEYLSEKELRLEYPDFNNQKLLEMYMRFKDEVITTLNDSEIKANRNLIF